VLCGVSVSTGYMAYFTSSAYISPTIAFGAYLGSDYCLCMGRSRKTTAASHIRRCRCQYHACMAGIVACNPVLAMIIDLLRYVLLPNQ
jgi:hypothetical protein